MSNFDTVKAITANIESVLKAQGIGFNLATDETLDKKAALTPYGEIFYISETFEYTHGQKPEYAEAEFKIRIVLFNPNPRDMVREQQKWVHLIREALTVNALNVGGLVATKYVSRVTTDTVTIGSNGDGFADLDYTILIRYREV